MCVHVSVCVCLYVRVSVCEGMGCVSVCILASVPHCPDSLCSEQTAAVW